MDQVRPLPIQSALRPRTRRLVGLSSSDPTRWRPRADPVQKRDPGEDDDAKGIDQSRPVTEGWAKARSAVPTRMINESSLRWWARRLRRLCPRYVSSLCALPDRYPPAGKLHRFFGKLRVRHLLHRRLLRFFDVAIGDAVFDRPLRALGI